MKVRNGFVSNSSSSSFIISIPKDIENVDDYVKYIKDKFGDDYDGFKTIYNYELFNYSKCYTITDAIRKVYSDMQELTKDNIPNWMGYPIDKLPFLTGFDIIQNDAGPFNLGQTLNYLGKLTDEEEEKFIEKWENLFKEWNDLSLQAYIDYCLFIGVKLYTVTYSDECGQGDMEHGDHWDFIDPVVINQH